MHKELIFQINSHSETDSEELVISRLGMQSIPYAVYLEGQVGAGKTFFCKQIARLYGIDSLESSSFLNYSTYYGSFKVVHVDYYYNKHPVEFFSPPCGRAYLQARLHSHDAPHQLSGCEWSSTQCPFGVAAAPAATESSVTSVRRHSVGDGGAQQTPSGA